MPLAERTHYGVQIVRDLREIWFTGRTTNQQSIISIALYHFAHAAIKFTVAWDLFHGIRLVYILSPGHSRKPE